MAKSHLVDIKYRAIVHETDGAYLFSFEKDKPHVWLPKSQCEVDEDAEIVTMSETLAVDKEIEGYVI